MESLAFQENSNTTLVKVKFKFTLSCFRYWTIQIQLLLKLNPVVSLVIIKAFKYSNTTLVKVKSAGPLALSSTSFYSNTTLVIVKLA